MAVKFKIGKTYYVEHADRMWSGHVKVLDVNEEGLPMVHLTKLITGGKGVQNYFDKRKDPGAWLGSVNWKQKEINMTLENK